MHMKKFRFVEKRKHPRLRETIPLKVKTVTGIRFATSTINLSASGSYFGVHRLIPKAPSMKLKIDFYAGNEPVSCEADLVRVDLTGRVDEYNWAVQFARITQGNRQKIIKYINERL
jgi:hypothetical protein